MTALALLRRFWFVPLILALLIAALWLYGSWQGALRQRDDERRAHEITVSNYRAAALEREKSDLLNISRVKGESDAISTATVDDYEQRIAALRSDFAERVRAEAATGQRSAASSSVSSVSDGASGTDARTCQAELLETQLAASELAEQVVGLQSWIKKTAAIDTNGQT